MRPDYCPIGGQPCQSLCVTPCTTRSSKEWVGLTDEEVMRAADRAGFNIEVDNDAEEASDELHWWDGNGEQSDDALFKLRDYIEAKLKEKNT